MTQPIDVAYVDIVARTKEFRREIRDVIDDEVKDLERELDSALDEIDKHFASTAKEADKAFKDIEDTVKETSTTIEHEIGGAVKKIGNDSDDLRRTVGSNFDKMFLHAAENGQFVEKRVVPTWRDAMRHIGDAASDAFNTAKSAAGSFLSTIGSGPFVITALIVALPPLIALLIALGAALADLSGLLALIPGALTILAATIAPLIIGFQNFGDALSAVLGGDKDEITEAFKKLAPAARTVAKEFGKIVEPFKQLQLRVQQGLFTPLIGVLTRITNSLIGPLSNGLFIVANVLGQIIAMFGDLIASETGIAAINAIFMTTAQMLQNFGPALLSVFGAFLNLVVASLPAIKLLSDKFSAALVNFAEFLNRAIEDGTFQAFIDDAIATLKEILALGGAIIAFFGALFTQDTADAGRAIIMVLTDLFNVMTKFLQSTEGKKFLEDVATLAVVAIHVLSGLIIIFATLVQTSIEAIVIVLDFFGIVKRGFEETSQVATNTTGVIVDAISNVPARLMALGGTFLNAGKFLIQSFINGFRNPGTFINDVAGDIVRGIKSGLNRFISTINSGIAALDAALPFSLSRIPSLAEGGIVSARPGGVLAQLAEGGEDEVVSPLSDLKTMIKDAVGASQAITFEPGAINVSFSGVVPTTSQAREVGQAVGEGIINTLTRRNLRAQVRAI